MLDLVEDEGLDEAAGLRKRTASERSPIGQTADQAAGQVVDLAAGQAAHSHSRTGSLRLRDKVQPGFRRGVSVESSHSVPPMLASPVRTTVIPSSPLGDTRASTYDNVPPSSGHAGQAADPYTRLAHSASPTPDRSPQGWYGANSPLEMLSVNKVV